MKKAIGIALALLVLGLMAAACGGRPASPAAPTAPPPTATSAPRATVAPAAATRTAATATSAPRPAAVPAVATRPAPTETPVSEREEVLSLDSRNAGLDQLKSYRVRWQAEWRSTEAGKTESGSWDFIEEYTTEPNAVHFSWRVASTSSESTAIEIWRIGDTTYVQGGEPGKSAECFAISSEDQSQSITRNMFDPRLLGSLVGARYVGLETVNGIKARHYKYDEKATSLTDIARVSGEIWVAVDGGYTVKDTVSWSGSAVFFGGASTGTGEGKWTWELLEVNPSLTIAPPANCVAPEAGLPVLPDAKEKTSMGPVLMYKSATSMADAVKFYKEQMGAAGWKLTDENAMGGQLTQLAFEKAGTVAQVMISVADSAIQVMITTEK